MRMRPGGVAALVAACVLSAGGACGDDAGTDPDAEVPIDAAAPTDAASTDALVDASGGAPGPVTGFVATPTGAGEVSLAWTNPTDVGFAGVIIVRHIAVPVVEAPVDGTTYAVDDLLGAGDVVIYEGVGAAAVDEGLGPGLIYYAAYARSGDARWSTAATASAELAVPPQDATITVDFTPAVVATVTTQPPDYVLAATATWDDPTDTLTVHLEATSVIARNVFAPKAVIASASQGFVTEDGALDGLPFVRLGQAIAPGATGEADLVFTDVDGTIDPIEINLSIVDNAAGVVFGRYSNEVAYELIDAATWTSMGTVPCDELRYVDPEGNNNGYCAHRAGGLSADGRSMYTGHRALPLIREVDLASGLTVRSLSLDAGLGGIRAVELSPDGTTLYALLTLRAHSYWGGINGDLAGPTADQVVVAIDVATLTETDRAVVIADGVHDESRLSGIAVSPDGTQLAVSELGPNAVVHVLDAATLDEVEAVDVSAVVIDLKQVVYDGDGSTIYVQPNVSTGLAAIDTTTFEVEAVAVTGGGGRPGDLFRDEDGVVFAVYAPGESAMTRLDGEDQLTATALTRLRAGAVYDGRLYLASEGAQLLVFDAETLVEEPDDGALLEIDPGHGMLFTPF